MVQVLILCEHLQRTLELYRDLFATYDVQVDAPSLNGKQQMDEADLLAIIDQYDGVIAGDDEFTEKVLAKGAAHRLKVVAKWGIGVDGIDLEAAKRFGIPVYNTPAAFSDEVADVATGYLILLARQLHKLNESVRSGGWLKHPGITLRGKTLGVIGVGSIGQAIVQRGMALGMNVIGYDPYPNSQFSETSGMPFVDLNSLLHSADFIVLSCALTAENHHLLSHEQFMLMKEGVHLINVARGPLIDETALVQALQNGKVAGAGLDVFETEPLPIDNVLHQFDNCIFGTHNSSNTKDAVLRVNIRSIQNLFDGLGIEANLIETELIETDE
ncbi:MAG: phosphoglycerate dehydrogenase [Chloroflexota bacterium]